MKAQWLPGGYSELGMGQLPRLSEWMVELVRIYGANALATVVTISTDFGPTEAALTAAATVILELVQGYSTFPSILRERSSPAHPLAGDSAPTDLMEP